MANGWTPERRARQAERIKMWKPWEHSTGPRTDAGKAAVARNAWKGGTRQMLRQMAQALREQSDGLSDFCGWQRLNVTRQVASSSAHRIRLP